MSKKLPTTPRSKVKSAIRQVWLRSRERAAALKRDGYACQYCGVKQSNAKGKEQFVEVHHVNGIDWDGVVDLIIERVLRPPEELRTVCPECHKSAHLEEQLNKKTGDRFITENRQPEPASLV